MLKRQLDLRVIQPGSTLAYAIHRLKDGTIVESSVNQDELRLFNAAKHPLKKLPEPEAGAQWIASGGGIPMLNTAGGLARIGDCFEIGRTLCIRIGQDHDFIYQTVDRSGQGFRLESSGNFLRLDRADYSGTLPAITLINPIPGVTIVNGWIEVADSPRKRTVDVDKKFRLKNSIAFDASTFFEENSVGTDASFSHTVTGADPGLAVGLEWDTNDATGSGTYNGDALTMEADMDEASAGRYGTVLSLVPPDTGANTVAVTGGFSFVRRVVAMSFTGVGAVRDGTGAAGTTNDPSTNITTVADDMVFDFLYVRNSAGVTVGADQTERENENVFTGEYIVSSTELATGTTTTMSHTTSANSWVHGLIAFEPAAAAGSILLFVSDDMAGMSGGMRGMRG